MQDVSGSLDARAGPVGARQLRQKRSGLKELFYRFNINDLWLRDYVEKDLFMIVLSSWSRSLGWNPMEY